MPEEVQDLKEPNRIHPSVGKNLPVTVEDLNLVGITHWKLDSEALMKPTPPPVRNIHWDDQDILDSDNNSILASSPPTSYANIINLNPENLHIRSSATYHKSSTSKSCSSSYSDHKSHSSSHHGFGSSNDICYLTFGSGFLDVKEDDCRSWIRMQVTRGDIITLPDGLYHRFTEASQEDASTNIEDVGYFAGQHYRTPLVRIMIERSHNDNRQKSSSAPPTLPLTPQAV